MQAEPMSPVDRGLRVLLSSASHARVALARRLGMGLREVEAAEHVMVTARFEGRAVGPAELARRLGVSTAASTQVLNRLESDGHVRRLPHAQDRRRQVLEVTPTGAAHVMTELGPLLGALSAVTAHRDARDQAVIARYLADVAEVFDRYAQS